MMWTSFALVLLANCGVSQAWDVTSPENSTYYNPILPGWHSDPSCIHVKGTFYCATSSFTAFPGLPIYASKDLINWKQINNIWNRMEQLPAINRKTHDQQDGFFAPNLRYHDGEFFMTCVYAQDRLIGILGTVFRTKDIFGEWSVPVTWDATPSLAIDPDLFWDDDGMVYLTSAGIIQQTININTGAVSNATSIWNGTGAAFPEGPHIYKKDGWCYLLIAEGGTQLGHRISIARSKNISGPYETTGARNPLLTNSNTTEYFQTVGHADLFQDDVGSWWGVALSTRSFGDTLQVVPSLANLTGQQGGSDLLAGVDGVSFVGRRQSHTLFDFSADLNFAPQSFEGEAGITVFYTQMQHIDLGVGLVNDTAPHEGSWQLLLRSTNQTSTVSFTPIPADWPRDGVCRIRLRVQSANDTTYRFPASLVSNPSSLVIMGYASTEVVTAELTNSGSGSLLGIYSTCNGANGDNLTQCPNGEYAYFSRWRYSGLAQEIADGEFVISM
ncbi:hypothetical protein LTR78_003574 [Recurvomyces mirabilis]|uniref:Beta-xylosidase C-terminal Concanavalin A-like domain-containing protein n=1 Tax=Recurvomyces mirabilis TaxID=574656 RepID=A0AAE0WS18_9PEZI|nr:hypothetical protein LTR78_003574 [Recurvomyces mirabilis]KAK5154395.1 hypothetical protein LTS14_006530 [Recurvomyces mirabilis]